MHKIKKDDMVKIIAGKDKDKLVSSERRHQEERSCR